MKRAIRVALYVAGGIVCVIVVAGAAVYGASESRFRRVWAPPTSRLNVPTDSATIARGEHLGTSIAGCVDCHGSDLSGRKVIDNLPLGVIYGRNLTRGSGGVGDSLADQDFVNAIRHGVGSDGRPLRIMPSSDYAALSDADLVAIIAWVRSVPPVDHVVPRVSIGPVGRALLLAGKLPILHAERIDHGHRPPASVTAEATAAYGDYLASVGCKGCHRQTLTGGPIVDGPPNWPPAANLTPAGNLAKWTEVDFRRLLREGQRPGGIPVNDVMPWRFTKNLTDNEITALWRYLRTLPPTPTAS